MAVPLAASQPRYERDAILQDRCHQTHILTKTIRVRLRRADKVLALPRRTAGTRALAPTGRWSPSVTRLLARFRADRRLGAAVSWLIGLGWSAHIARFRTKSIWSGSAPALSAGCCRGLPPARPG
jgi:hypothetical protein